MLKSSTHIELDFNQLTIWKPSADDNGQYQCSARNYRKTVHSEKFLISIDDINENRNHDARLKCAQRRINSYNSVNIDQNGKILSRNLRHTRDNRMELLCRSKRNGKEKKGELVVESGFPAILNCNVKFLGKSSSSGLKVNWTKDGKYFRQVELGAEGDDGMEGMSRISVSKKNGSLIIASTIIGDIGSYECKVFDDTTTLSVHATKLDITEVLKFVPRPTSKHIELGSTGKIHCKAQGTPTPTIRWTKVLLLYNIYFFRFVTLAIPLFSFCHKLELRLKGSIYFS